ncbi:hypothetical protein Mia14_0427 [Candidatus Mancarchaeum acidiphilum]|uniref:Uncharacterized protein n=1 Tax=Candidatus Mancarchaeum acidiphilum TaxID=1920749 RepID=A0A218NMP8_9ARCH|nr:hypothetical protein [Candidatus Mancarchaeum acidiphilum]ASI13745.1 hypothetical protein Mia14_0427 [Candidatus Mancarchaeum acidiphilum]
MNGDCGDSVYDYLVLLSEGKTIKDSMNSLKKGISTATDNDEVDGTIPEFNGKTVIFRRKEIGRWDYQAFDLPVYKTKNGFMSVLLIRRDLVNSIIAKQLLTDDNDLIVYKKYKFLIFKINRYELERTIKTISYRIAYFYKENLKKKGLPFDQSLLPVYIEKPANDSDVLHAIYGEFQTIKANLEIELKRIADKQYNSTFVSSH